jgi:AraC-like DNA-binding protein
MIYEYKLEGYDNEWQTVTGSNEVSYYDLPIGHYTFHVRLQGDVTSEETISVTISPLFLFIFWAFIALTIISIILIGRHYLYKKKAEKKESTQSLHDESPKTPSLPTQEQQPLKQEEEKYKFAKLSNEESKQICENLIGYMKREKPYINPELKISDLANAINCSSHSLSYVFNQYLNQNYYDFVNEYRVAEFKLLVNDARYSKYTLSALSEKCGFSSRASFFRSFKKLTGITPNEYIQQLESTKHD